MELSPLFDNNRIYQGCMQKFCKGGGELGVFKKRGGQHQGEHWKTMLKNSSVILRGGE